MKLFASLALATLALATFALAATSARAAEIPSATDLTETIQHDGARATLDRLLERGQFVAVISLMAKGEDDWIGLAPALAPGADAATAEQLASALALALPVNPHAVLQAIDPQDGAALGARRVCSLPFADGAIADRAGLRQRSLHALSRVSDRALAKAKAACHAALTAAA